MLSNVFLPNFFQGLDQQYLIQIDPSLNQADLHKVKANVDSTFFDFRKADRALPNIFSVSQQLRTL
jgi:hypothetical protein